MGLYWIQKRSSSANLRLGLSVFQQSQIHKICLILSSSALPWFHTGRVRISVVWLISLHHLHQSLTWYKTSLEEDGEDALVAKPHPKVDPCGGHPRKKTA